MHKKCNNSEANCHGVISAHVGLDVKSRQTKDIHFGTSSYMSIHLNIPICMRTFSSV